MPAHEEGRFERASEKDARDKLLADVARSREAVDRADEELGRNTLRAGKPVQSLRSLAHEVDTAKVELTVRTVTTMRRPKPNQGESLGWCSRSSCA